MLYHELNGTRKQYQVINQVRLLNLLATSDVAVFRNWYERTLTERCMQEEFTREPYWSRAFAVGSRSWLHQLTGGNSRAGEDQAHRWHKRRRRGGLMRPESSPVSLSSAVECTGGMTVPLDENWQARRFYT